MNSVQSLFRTLLLFAVASTATAAETNVMCPVLQDRAATDDYVATYKGTEVRFCCSECVKEFRSNPEIYENVIPQLQHLPIRVRLQNFLGDYGGIAISAGLLALLVGLRVHRHYYPAGKDSSSALSTLLQQRISPTFPLLALSCWLGYEVWSLHTQLHGLQLEDEIHFATFYDFGYPPVPKRPDKPVELSGSYYRGNDERSPKLFNNGNYRTAAFHLSLCDDSGAKVEAGSNVSEKSLFLRFEIERPPFTPDFLYEPKMMNTMFLTEECDRFLGKDAAVDDAVYLTETETMQHWEARFPIAAAQSCCDESRRGTIYVCEEYFHQPTLSFLPKQRGGSRFHYGIRYELNVVDGVLQDDSDIYMGALYRTRKLPTWRVPMTEWFSHEPIPELPSENTSDPELLGLPEHLSRVK
jgi:YHS domain-containing protein